MKFDVAGIQLENGTLAYRDEGSGQTLEVRHLELRTGRIAEDVPGKLSLGAQLKGKQPLVDAKVALETGYLFSLAREAYALTGMSLKVEGTAADFSRLELVLSGDLRADLAPHSAKLYAGTLQGALTLHANGNRVAMKETLGNVSIGPLVKDLMARDALEGQGNLALDVTAAGATVNAMKQSLGGTARVTLRDGALKGFNLTEALRKTKAAFGSKSAQQQPSDAAQRTDFSEMTASFVIKDGVARNDDLDVKAPLVRLGGSGDIDIGKSQLNYVARATVVATAKGQGGADLDHLAGLTVPVKLTGPFDAPKYEIDYRALAAGAAKAKATEKVKDKLRNLLRR